jgi:formylglycine-generating enzyme required for sulfatase activity
MNLQHQWKVLLAHTLTVALVGLIGCASQIYGNSDNKYVDHTSAMVAVPGGTMTLGASDLSDNPPRSVTIASFEIDITEVTVAAYYDCVAAAACSRDDYKKEMIDKNAFDPIQSVSWDDATAYCAWVGKRLPTEWEWEYAARYDDGRAYPWGNDIPVKSLACFGTSFACPVGSKPDGASKLGIQDLAGNVAEWTDSWFCSPPPCSSGSSRVVRGGSHSDPYTDTLRAAHREGGIGDLGFRCARGQ